MPPPDPIIDQEEDYASSEDSDFAPGEDAPQVDAEESSDDEAPGDAGATEAAAAAGRKRKQAGDGGDGAEDLGFENSGDEAIIEKGNKKRRKRDKAQQPDDEGGEGGLIKTRSMRAVEKAERKAQPVAGPVTVDVDALWASMTAAPVLSTTQEPRPAGPREGELEADAQEEADAPTSRAREAELGETIKIKRTYNFAGKVHTEEKLVPRDSAEARLYLASKGGGTNNPAAAAAADDDDDAEGADDPDRRVPRRAFRSRFEPVVDGSGQRADLNLGIATRMRARGDRAKKLNTVEKSRMDWAGFVDKEGIKDELALAGRAKGAFADRQEFLARTEARRDEDARRVRLAGKV